MSLSHQQSSDGLSSYQIPVLQLVCQLNEVKAMDRFFRHQLLSDSGARFLSVKFEGDHWFKPWVHACVEVHLVGCLWTRCCGITHCSKLSDRGQQGPLLIVYVPCQVRSLLPQSISMASISVIEIMRPIVEKLYVRRTKQSRKQSECWFSTWGVKACVFRALQTSTHWTFRLFRLKFSRNLYFC